MALNTMEIDFYESRGCKLLPWRHNVPGYMTEAKKLNVYCKHLDCVLLDIDSTYYGVV